MSPWPAIRSLTSDVSLDGIRISEIATWRDTLIEELFERRRPHRRCGHAAVAVHHLKMRAARRHEHANDAAFDQRVEIAGVRLERAHVALGRRRRGRSDRGMSTGAAVVGGVACSRRRPYRFRFAAADHTSPASHTLAARPISAILARLR